MSVRCVMSLLCLFVISHDLSHVVRVSVVVSLSRVSLMMSSHDVLMMSFDNVLCSVCYVLRRI